MSSPSENTTPLGEWVDHIIYLTFFQPDDELSEQSIQTSFSRDLKVRINGTALTYEDYKNAIARNRAQYEFSVESNRELLASREPSEARNGGGSVAHISTFTVKDKQTGSVKRESTVTLATVGSVDGKRMLLELTEVYRSA
ncbi:hypothetical protein ASPBRDRAFT_204260 [Aspergillus brasiliensis CBS 101740]|uniref:SnoaL-like domain-containing protein n=1 Tax=Aspergillus brasiliensis (strain CBS 101740 / IMI 381727 / IBT 21946) TaxID=767769 RepID=A0A1L9UYF3_ASPBC|nr:hypothetical protein ASPBRDRAFT_204260 [Aspergillus brasiliensis CBS 101740]